MLETCLWVMTRRNLFGIKLTELGRKKEVEDWFKEKDEDWFKEKDKDWLKLQNLESTISLLPFDIRLNLPEMAMFPFVFDSNLFLAGGYIERYRISGTGREPEPYGLSYKIYHLFEDVNNNLRISEAPAHYIPPPPTAVSDSFVANIAGEVYLLVYDKIMELRVNGFWVLRSALWRRLPDPPSLNAIGFADSCECFVHLDKLFLQVEYVDETQLSLYAFDPRTVTWTKVENNIRDSFAIWDSDDYCFPEIVVSLPDVCNCRVTLSWSFEKAPGDYQVRVKINAMLVNNKDNSVFCYQSLDDCSNAIKLRSFHSFSTNVKFVDLGDGMVCALVNGNVPEHDDGLSPVLCILVFALSLAEEPDTEAPVRKEQRFLSVDGVLVNQVFTMKDYVRDYKSEELLHAFVFPPNKKFPRKHAYSKGSIAWIAAMVGESSSTVSDPSSTVSDPPSTVSHPSSTVSDPPSKVSHPPSKVRRRS